MTGGASNGPELAGGACLDGTPRREAHSLIASPVGVLRATASQAGVMALHFSDDRVEACGLDVPDAAGPEARAMLDRLARELAEYFAGTRRAFEVPLVIAGSEYQRAAWKQLSCIEYGRTIAYGELARRVHDPDGARAAAAACGQNRLPILIPCHRVIAADGTLWGFGGGLERKAFLLEHEARVSGRYEPGLFG